MFREVGGGAEGGTTGDRAPVADRSISSEPISAEPGAVPEMPSGSASALRAGSRPASGDWRGRYTRRIWSSDLIVLVCVVFGTQVVWFGLGNAQVAMDEDLRLTELTYWEFSTLLVLAWMWALALVDSRSERVTGAGATEYIRVVDASIRLFGLVAIVAFLTRIDVARGFLLLSLPIGILCLSIERWLWRRWLLAKRRKGQYCARVLLVGSAGSVTALARELKRSPAAGLQVVGVCVPGGRAGTTLTESDLPVAGSVDTIQAALRSTMADTVAITSSDELPAARVKQIAWGLEAGREHLVLAPSIVDIAGPRIHMRSVAGLPLIHVETPRFSSGQWLSKRSMDIGLTTLGLIVLSPLMLLLALAVRLTSPGPVLFRQTRIGRRGQPFEMLKFRSMVNGAEDQLGALTSHQDAGNEVLFKMHNDPRVTRIGHLMRRHSLDELPQLFNVLSGSMSLVGPRPPLAREVERYDRHVHRRFLVKPGITGLWQVSGRSSLSWSDSVRLDLSYVENWTLVGDFVILLKTVRAVLTPGNVAT